MFFSIVIPTFNREKTIMRAVDSILNQTFSNFEIIIVDDGSIDNTEKIVNSYNRSNINYFKTENF